VSQEKQDRKEKAVGI